MSEFSQTVPELVAWARKNDFSISLPVDRLSFLLAIATLNGERLEGEMSEGELVMRSATSVMRLSRPAKPSASAPITRSTIWCASVC